MASNDLLSDEEWEAQEKEKSAAMEHAREAREHDKSEGQAAEAGEGAESKEVEAESKPARSEYRWLFPVLVAMGSLLLITMVMMVYNTLLLSDLSSRVAPSDIALEDTEASETEVKPEVQPIVLKEMTISLANKASNCLLQVVIAVDVNKDADLSKLISHETAVRDAIITVVSGKMSYGLATPEGKEKLRNELLAALNDTVQGAATVHALRFEKFIVL